MPDKFLVPNSFQYPNAYVDDYMRLLTGDEFKVMSITVRKTFGWSKTQDEISVSQYCELTGLSRPAVIDILARLCKFGLVVKVSDGKGKHGDVYAPQTNYNKVDRAALQARGNDGAKLAKQRDRMNHARAVKTANRKPESSGQPGLPDAVNPVDCNAVNGVDTQNPIKPNLNPLGANAPRATKTEPPVFPPEGKTVMSEGVDMDVLEDIFNRACGIQSNPNPATIRGWNLPAHLERLCLDFQDVFGVKVMKGDKGQWAKGAKVLHELRVTRATMERAKRENPRLTLTWPGALQNLECVRDCKAEEAEQFDYVLIPGTNDYQQVRRNGTQH